MNTKEYTKAPNILYETENMRPVLAAISFLRHSGIHYTLFSNYTDAIHAPDPDIESWHIHQAAQKACGELAQTAGFWSASHGIRSDFDSNYRYPTGGPPTAIDRNGDIRTAWWNQGDKQKRMETDYAFLTFFNTTMRPIDYGFTISKPQKNYQFFFNELWHLLTSQDISKTVSILAQKAGTDFETMWLTVAKTSLMFCKTVDEEQVKTNGAFIPPTQFLPRPVDR